MPSLRAGWATLLPLLLLPPLATLSGLDLVVPFALWITAAGVLRTGSSLFDRLLLSGLFLAGATTGIGLLLSLWPWGLDPLPVGELGFALLIAAAAVTGRRFSLPWRFPSRDAVLAAGSLGIVLVYLWPLLGSGAAQRLSSYITAEDLARHFGLFDSIRTLGGYAFLHSAQNQPVLQAGMSAYPQGSHFVLAVVDRFLHPGTSTTVTELPHFIELTTLVCAAFTITVCWAACRVAGPRLGAAAALPLVLAVGGYLVASEGTSMLQDGFVSELFGLALFAALLAVAIRPVDRPREQLLLMAVLVVGIGFGYYLWLPAAGAVALASLLVHRPRVAERRQSLVLGCAMAATGILALVPVAANWTVVNSASALNTAGGITPVNRHLLWPLVAAAALVTLLALVRGERTARVTAAVLLVAGGVAGLVMLYQLHSLGHSSYYFEKMLHQLVVAALVSLGSVGVLLPAGDRATRSLRAQTGLVSLAASVLVVVTLGYNAQSDHAASTSAGSKLQNYLRGSTWEVPVARLVLAKAQVVGFGEQSAPTLVMAESLQANYQGNYYATLWLNVLDRTSGRAAQLSSWAFVPVQRVQGIPHTLAGQLETLSGPLQVLSDNHTVRQTVLTFQRNHPDSAITVEQP
ncbi:hypothetical protein [Streptacidiphilus sp. P02-A3a]|uniref:hypothetical protein n=1 Tax=Streptacidiphilus sp. P02-A3a TaxID=2704468 RepID=UPI0015F862BE|nr:hypothetical protein [Streptacidiphilus sp. P02-A3a]QMU72741.1 hypothetical protein GXP74_35315 [Streptacidiphilus sp. P02-A3a]